MVERRPDIAKDMRRWLRSKEGQRQLKAAEDEVNRVEEELDKRVLYLRKN